MSSEVENILRKIQNLVCIDKKYRLSQHVIDDYLYQGKCSYEDIIYCIQNAKTINGINEDKKGTPATDGCLYTIIGENEAGIDFYTTGKFIKNREDEELYFFVTAHEMEEER